MNRVCRRIKLMEALPEARVGRTGTPIAAMITRLRLLRTRLERLNAIFHLNFFQKCLVYNRINRVSSDMAILEQRLTPKWLLMWTITMEMNTLHPRVSLLAILLHRALSPWAHTFKLLLRIHPTILPWKTSFQKDKTLSFSAKRIRVGTKSYSNKKYTKWTSFLTYYPITRSRLVT